MTSTSSNKVALITGSSSGIGRSLALKAAIIGYNVGVIARNKQALEALKNEVIESYNIDFHYHIGDVSKEEDCRAFINGCIDKFGRIDFLFNNAGISMRGIFADTDLSVIKQLMDVNFWGSVYCTKYALPELLKTKGSVIGVSSIAGFKGLPARTGYSASKFAMQGFLESLRNENLKTGLHVLIACPGYTESNIRKTALNPEGKAQGETPLNEEKLMSADDVAESIWNATLKRRLYLILTAQGKAAVWINKLFPKLADKLTYNVIKKEPNSPFQ
ncbi:MAG: SDR family oxidoreductase [Bacteroidia bacterium]|nr:SDR family oxidoreductase [Bacteroidia bacterium]